MSADEFLKQICESPQDDELRLVFADWLSERSDPRGEFIRQQVLMTQHHPCSPISKAAEIKSDQLLREFQRNWDAEVPKWSRKHGSEVVSRNRDERVYRRGFRHLIKIPIQQFQNLKSQDMCFAPITGASIFDVRDKGEGLTKCKLLNHFENLKIRFNFVKPSVKKVLQILDLDAIRNLELNFAPFEFSRPASNTIWTADDVEFLSVDSGSNNLENLVLCNNDIGDDGAKYLATSQNLSSLQGLDLANCNVGDAGLKAIARSDLMGRIKFLNIAHNYVSNGGVKAIADCKPSCLKTLKIKAQAPIRSGLRALSCCKELDTLEELDLYGQPIGSSEIGSIANSKAFRNLRVLGLGSTLLDDRLAIQLANSPDYTSLYRLDLEHNRITARGLESLVASDWIRRVTTLGLYGNPIKDDGAAVIAKSTMLDELCDLRLTGTGMSSTGAEAILQSKNFPKLRSVNLAGIQIQNRVVKLMLKCEHLESLDRLVLYNCGIGEKQTLELIEKFGSRVHLPRPAV